MKLDKLASLIIFFSLLVTSAFAAPLKLTTHLALGAAGVTVDGITRTEGPLGFGFGAEYFYNNRWVFGIEHARSLDTASASSSISLTGTTARWYWATPAPQQLLQDETNADHSFLIQKTLSPYVGAAFGFAQSSKQKVDEDDPDLSTGGYYVSLKAGIEYPLFGKWGGRAEFNSAISAGGVGSILFFHLNFGIYRHF